MAFHRLGVPSYFGGLPGGYDYINNAIAGTPAFADGVKGAGPNVGTYFIAFGEDGTSSDANRPAKALAQNTDYLDDLLHRDIAVPTRSIDVTAVGAISSLVYGAGTYVGAAGTPNTPAGINSFVEILDANDNEIIIPATGQKCQVTSITGPAVGSGFSPGAVTFNISPSIPNGQTYRVYTAVRGNLATLPDDALTSIKIRGAQEIPAAFEDFQKQISRMSGSNVLALVASILETPDGVRLAKSNTMSLDVDPDGTVGGIHSFILRRGRDAAARTLLEVNDDPALGGAAANRLKMASGMVAEFLGTGLLRDANIAAGAAQGGPFIPLTSATAGKGDQYLRVFEYGTNPSGFVPSVFQHANARWTCTVGDGSSSFGDFSGATALKDAIDFAISKGWSNIRIQVKTGNYASTTIAITTQTVVLEGIEGSTYVNPASAGATFTVGAGELHLKGLTVQTFGGPYAVDMTASSLLYLDDCRMEGSVRLTNVTNTAGSHAIVARRTTFLNSAAGMGCVEGVYNVHARPWLFEECAFVPTTGPVFKLSMGTQTLAVTAVHDGIDCVECRFNLSSTTITTAAKTNGVLAVNTGLIDFNPNTKDNRAGTDGLKIRAIKFVRSRVIASAVTDGSAENVILHLLPTPNGTNAAASVSQWMDVDDLIFDGTYIEATLNSWAGGVGPWAHGVSPFICAGAVNVQFLNGSRIKWLNNSSGTQTNGYITDDAAYCFGTGVTAVPVTAGGGLAIAAPGQLVVEGLRCDGWLQGAVTPDARLHIGDIQVRRWTNTYKALAGATRPFCRFLLTPYDAGSGHGVVEDLELIGATTVASDWTTAVANGANGAILAAGYVALPGLRLVRPVVRSFRDSGNVTSAMVGICIQDTADVVTATGLSLSGGISNVYVLGGYLERLDHGIFIIAEDTEPLTNVIIDGVKITRCRGTGIRVGAVLGALVNYLEPLTIRNCNITLCTSFGILILLNLTVTAVRVQDNHVYNNNANDVQISITSSTATCWHVVYGNVTMLAKIQISANGSVLTSPTDRSSQYYGSETGVGSLGTISTLYYTNTNVMLHNDAYLQTP